MSMNMVFSGETYQVLEYPEINAFELLDRAHSTGALIQGDVASAFRENLLNLFAFNPTEEAFDEMLGGYKSLMNWPVCFH